MKKKKPSCIEIPVTIKGFNKATKAVERLAKEMNKATASFEAMTKAMQEFAKAIPCEIEVVAEEKGKRNDR